MDPNSFPRNFKVCAIGMGYGIQLHHSSPYYPQENEQAEATNKTLIKILKKTYKSNKFFDWPEKLIDNLWAYRTSFRTPIG